MRKLIYAACALLLCALPGCAKVTVDAPKALDNGATGTVTVTVVNDNVGTAARDVTLVATLSWRDGGAYGPLSKITSHPVTVHLAAGDAKPMTGLVYPFPVAEGLVYDWTTATITGDAVGARLDSAHTAAADSLAPGKSWSVAVKVRAQ